MSLTFIVFKEDAGRPVQLADDNAFASVNHKGSLVRHERDFAHVDVVFADFLNGSGSCRVTVIDFELNFRSQGGTVGQTAQLAFIDIKFARQEFIT